MHKITSTSPRLCGGYRCHRHLSIEPSFQQLAKLFHARSLTTDASIYVRIFFESKACSCIKARITTDAQTPPKAAGKYEIVP